WTFDRVGMSGSPSAQTLYTYDDDSAHNLTPQGWEPPSAPATRCQDASGPEYAFHLTGGPFRDYGGGIGTRFDRLNTSGNCGSSEPELRADYCPPLGTEYPFDAHTIDVRGYEGISFWARRGPDSQPLLRVMVGDKRTDDDISYLMYEYDPDQPRYCERNLVCDCRRNVPCSEAVVPDDNGEPRTIFACFDPETEPYPVDARSYDLCGDWVCSEPFPAFPNFEGDEPFEP